VNAAARRAKADASRSGRRRTREKSGSKLEGKTESLGEFVRVGIWKVATHEEDRRSRRLLDAIDVHSIFLRNDNAWDASGGFCHVGFAKQI
jgi:hypothetical protein